MTQTSAGTIRTLLPADGCLLARSDGLTDAEPNSVLAQILHDHQDRQAAFEL